MKSYYPYLALVWMDLIYAGPFDKAEDKTQTFLDFLKGNFALVIMGIVIVVAGFLIMFNKVRPELGMRIIGGAIIVGSSVEIATWALA
ncbi:MAG: TrbC/VirB2 family protein [Gammaproteobacteria bacterium]|nr:TrbC/VirB2 family protein [Gammaproteobacteria bacterium]